MKKSRSGKYREYEKRVLQFIIKQTSSIESVHLKKELKIPRSSLYDVLGTLRDHGYIEWIGEPQDWISMIRITEEGKNHLKHLLIKY